MPHEHAVAIALVALDSPNEVSCSKFQMLQVPEFAQLGSVFRTTAPIELTEPETEYVVKVVKHIFEEHVVLQFNCTNTVNDQLLERECGPPTIMTILRK